MIESVSEEEKWGIESVERREYTSIPGLLETRTERDINSLNILWNASERVVFMDLD